LIAMAIITPQPVVEYLSGLRRDPHERLALIDREGRAEGLPLVYPDTGALLHTLARSCGAKRILEIGTAIGYSTLWMATALPADGALISMEYDGARAARARDHFAAALTLILYYTIRQSQLIMRYVFSAPSGTVQLQPGPPRGRARAGLPGDTSQPAWLDRQSDSRSRTTARRSPRCPCMPCMKIGRC
jgi:hypothetical protein